MDHDLATFDQAPPDMAAGADPLSERQLQVLLLVAEGATDREIARSLSLSARTVGHYVAAIRTRLDARSRSHAVALAMRQGLLPGSRFAGQDG
jgi:DNA-binding CsgD family transcriptional regulator